MSKQVLLIDDDPDDVEVFADALKDLAMATTFHSFCDGVSALEKLSDRSISPPDIIFLDINMPMISGWDCLRKLKTIAFLRQIPIVMYSTSSPEQEGLAASDVGAAAFLTKPNTMRELTKNLDDLFASIFPPVNFQGSTVNEIPG